MFKHNLLFMYRSFRRFKSSFFINLIGLSTGLACTLLIYLWVNDELYVDKFNEKDSQLYQVMENQHDAGNIRTQPYTPDMLAESMAGELPEVEYASAAFSADLISSSTLRVNEKNIKASGQFASKDYFNIFSFNLIRGNKDKVLAEKNSIVISEQLALKLFNTTRDIIGKPIEWQLGQFKDQVVVSGIFRDVPHNSSLQFDYALSFEEWFRLSGLMGRPINWDNHAPSTYIVLKKGTNIEQFNKKINGFIKSKLPTSSVTLFIKPYSQNYLYGKYENGVQAGGRIEYVRLFSIIAVFILLIACINFMNLSTAKASTRIKEVGIKKAIGAERKSLVLQYMGESMLMAFLSLMLALIAVEILLPQFNNITGKQLTLNYNANFILSILVVTLFTGLISGSYPALYLSGFKPAAILKGKLNSTTGERWARKGLVVFQFALSVIFIISVLVVYKQIEFIQSKNPGYNKDNVIYFDKDGKIAGNQETFLSEVKKIPGVLNVSSMGASVVGIQFSTIGVYWAGKNPDDIIPFSLVPVYYDLIETLGFEMKSGRAFSRDFGSETSAIIFNEAAINVMGLKDPIGKTVNVWGKEKQIVGVVKDFHFKSFHETVKPFFFMLVPEQTLKIMAKIKAGTEEETISRIKNFYETYNAGFTFDYKFLDEDYQAQYAAEKRVSILSRYFAGIAIIISCLGLFSLAAFTAEQRTKEIGIRKVLGANVTGIVALLSKDFLLLVLISFVIASPVAWYFMNNWLRDFAYHIDLAWWVFALSGILTVLIALATVSYQAVKAALANPVESLKYE